MSASKRFIHPGADFHWQPLAKLIPDVGVQMAPGANGGEPEVPMGLMFVDNDDQETHVYLFSEAGRKALVAALTGGVALP